MPPKAATAAAPAKAAKKAHSPRNHVLNAGVHKYGRSVSYAKSALYKKKKAEVKNTTKTRAQTKTVEVKGDKNGKTRVVPVRRESRFYPTEDTPRPLANRKTPGTATLRKSITPGTVLVLVAGRFRGKRVVFLKQLKSGLLLVSGPFKVNGVPLRRVNQAYVIATSTKVDLAGAKFDKFEDAYFAKAAAGKKSKTEAEFFESAAGAKAKKTIAAGRVADQKEVDKVIIAAVKKTPLLKEYLAAPFTLTKGQFPHQLKF
ncbi:60S ribosomal protein L6 [Capsaspora owczarzaki ATCC 30864]|uniref:60S ribosomal protein L6 n=1 Tax=Capsaspora owczarzaki (strain ATCC 30864) TaxID=595528 RepID=A0A0D2VIA1_CAPO3|nr:60S ribosomal protein L6 [Capsaspora owczarzaki ATCC 30864]KJE89672.1 60S ribosomal protein L6 [Capsaspora owczarzaki ATCC 30864]|eukprot:XP_004365977.1 60S ribosomal protein L6 [Capsaspora owczarzaki ATCC 30864]